MKEKNFFFKSTVFHDFKKHLTKLGIEGNYLNTKKATYKKSRANIILNGKIFVSKVSNKRVVTAYTISFSALYWKF